MYKCLECGHIFEEGEQGVYREKVGECQGAPAYQDIYVCPLCGEEYEEVKPCKVCGRHNTKNGEDYCEECSKDVLKKFQNVIQEQFTEKEIELLKELEEYGLL